SAVAACATIATDGAACAAVEQCITDEGRAEIIASPGLIAYEVYRTRKSPPGYVVLHRWRQLTDLEHFRAGTSRRQEQRLAELGTTLERFTGVLAATYPVDDTV
ncbi:MAG TPA: antibiotic biosynthesis monooxygenase, partial [Pseudonocardiaceae bacterium]